MTVYTKAVKRGAKLSAAYLAEYENALGWAALRTTEKALTGTGARIEPEPLVELPSNLA